MAEVKLQLGTTVNVDYGYTGTVFTGFVLDPASSPPEEIVIPPGTYEITRCQVAINFSPDPGPIDVSVGLRIYDDSGMVVDEEVTELGWSSTTPIVITPALQTFTVTTGARAYLWISVLTPDVTISIAEDSGVTFDYCYEPEEAPALIRQTISQDACVLGCPETRVYITDFCGTSIICDITENVTFLKWGRELDDDSEVEISVHLEGDSSGRGCCECLTNIRTWRNEVIIVRGGEIVWGSGPIVTIQIQRHIAHLVARDITAWLDVRLVHTNYNFVNADLATIAQTIVEDALLLGNAEQLPAAVRDACILDFATFTQTDKFTDIEIKANRRSAGEILRELAGQGLDFTVVNRALYVGADFAFGPIGPLYDEHFAEDLMVAERGLAAASKWFVSSETVQGEAGGPDDFFGLIERGVEGQPAATSVSDLSREAADRLAASFPPPLIVTVPSEGQLTQSAPICPKSLIPGTLVDLAINELCRPASVRERLTSVRFVLDDKGERAGITLAPLGELVGGEDAE